MWPFRRKLIVDDKTAAWHVDNLAWIIGQFGGAEGLANATLVLPRAGYFTVDGEQGHAFAVRIFDQIKAHCGMSHWEVELVADDNPLPDAAARAMVAAQKHALGTFGIAGNRIQISYVPALLAHPDRLIATLAHELAHYLLATAREPPPCAADETEFLTDLAAIYLGFGVFLANAKFNFETVSSAAMQGWRASASGYLPEADLVFALALFIHVKALDPGPALGCLKPHLAAMLQRTLRRLPDRAALLSPLRGFMPIRQPGGR